MPAPGSRRRRAYDTRRSLLAIQAPRERARGGSSPRRRRSQSEGQWTALRRFAAPDAICRSRTARIRRRGRLQGRADPPSGDHLDGGRSVGTSCDGTTAFTLGPMAARRRARPGHCSLSGASSRTADWKWLLDRARCRDGRERRAPEPHVTVASLRGTSSDLYVAGAGGGRPASCGRPIAHSGGVGERIVKAG